MSVRRQACSLFAAVVLGLAVPATAAADRGGGSAQGGGPGPGGGGEGGGGHTIEVRASGTCGRGAASELTLKQDGSRIEVELDVRYSRSSGAWRVVLVQEGRVVGRASIPNRGHGRSLSVKRTITALSGADRVTARASGPGGITCVASGILPG